MLMGIMQIVAYITIVALIFTNTVFYRKRKELKRRKAQLRYDMHSANIKLKKGGKRNAESANDTLRDKTR